MYTMINNYINGNLTEAKAQATKYTVSRIRSELIDSLGYSSKKAQLTAEWLKGKGSYQAACDAE